MKIISAEFVKSVYETIHCPNDGRPEVSFLGRSNVGKSSLLNSLLQRRKLARTSNTPGRTQSINYFLVNDQIYFVDLPGYGYARVSKSMRSDWGKMAEEYLADREELVLSIHLVDSRHEPTGLDMQLHEWLVTNEKPHIVVATKADKLSKRDLQKSLKILKSRMTDSTVMPYSSTSGDGRDQLWARIENSVKNK